MAADSLDWRAARGDTLSAETEGLLDSLAVPLDSLDALRWLDTDVPDIPDSLAAATGARVPSLQELFDYPVVVNSRVLAWIDTYLGRCRKTFERSLHRSGRYLAMSRRIFQEEGIPQDLAFLAHIESAFRHNARSPARALGLWQFMRGTATLYGLRCDSYVDERLDPEKATRAAARYLRDLYALYNDWNLALAAYNAGAGKVNRAIQRCNSQDFWALAGTSHLRNETRNFVPSMLAVTILAKSPGAYGLPIETEPPLEYDVVPVDVAVDLRAIARSAATSLDDLQELNPALIKGQTPPQTRGYELRVPRGTGEQFAAAIARIPPEDRMLQTRHRVSRGETLGLIARRYGTTVRAIQDANRMGRRTLIRTGQSLIVPSRGGGSAALAADAPAGQPVYYQVRRGQTLSEIARLHGCRVPEILELNGLRDANHIRAGQQLRIPGAAPETACAAPAEAAEERSPAEDCDRAAGGAPDEEPTSAAANAAPASPIPGLVADPTDSLGRGPSTAHIVEAARRSVKAEVQRAAESTAAVSAPTVHVVRRGDTLSGIAGQYGVALSDLRRWNNLRRSSVIRPGQEIKVVKPARAADSGDRQARVHVVSRGDSLWKIAQRYGVQVRELAHWNDLGSVGRIYPGQRLLVY